MQQRFENLDASASDCVVKASSILRIEPKLIDDSEGSSKDTDCESPDKFKKFVSGILEKHEINLDFDTLFQRCEEDIIDMLRKHEDITELQPPTILYCIFSCLREKLESRRPMLNSIIKKCQLIIDLTEEKMRHRNNPQMGCGLNRDPETVEREYRSGIYNVHQALRREIVNYQKFLDDPYEFIVDLKKIEHDPYEAIVHLEKIEKCIEDILGPTMDEVQGCVDLNIMSIDYLKELPTTDDIPEKEKLQMLNATYTVYTETRC